MSALSSWFLSQFWLQSAQGRVTDSRPEPPTGYTACSGRDVVIFSWSLKVTKISVTVPTWNKVSLTEWTWSRLLLAYSVGLDNGHQGSYWWNPALTLISHLFSFNCKKIVSQPAFDCDRKESVSLFESYYSLDWMKIAREQTLTVCW